MVKQEMQMKALPISRKVTYYLLYYKSTALLVSIIVTKQSFITEIWDFMLKRRKSYWGKIPKDRLTILCCSNADGSHKMSLFIVGKSKKPGYFRGLKSLPV